MFNTATEHSKTNRSSRSLLGRQAVGLLLAACAVVLAGCGYHFAGHGQLPGGINRIAVNVLKNRSTVNDIESTVTNALVNEISRWHQGVIGKGSDVQAALDGSIDSITWDTVSHRGVNTAAERRVYVNISLVLYDLDGNVLWKRARLAAEQAYSVDDSDKSATENNRRQAINLAAQRVAEEAYKSMIDNF